MKDGYEFSFFVPGQPVPGGSKTSIVLHKKGCPAGRKYNKGPCVCQPRAVVFDAAGERNRQWRHIVAQFGREAMNDNNLNIIIDRPMHVCLTFFLSRPKSHFKKDGSLRPSAPTYHTHKPDAIKLGRTVEDALTKVVWNDDSQTIELILRKYYASRNISVGCLIRVSVLPVHETDILDHNRSLLDLGT